MPKSKRKTDAAAEVDRPTRPTRVDRAGPVVSRIQTPAFRGFNTFDVQSDGTKVRIRINPHDNEQ